MTVMVSPITLWNVEGRAPEVGELLDAITEQQLIDWEGEWLPELFKAIQRQKRAGVERRHWPQSSHWNWREKTRAVQGMLGAPAFSVVCGGVTQGMMIIDTASKPCRLEGQRGKPQVYVDYVENAPWNRPELVDVPKYRGIGSLLIRAAVAVSEDLEFGGRIGLHALPQANDFYARTCGMTDLGPDAGYQNLRYFEMIPAQAQAFIEKGGTS